MSNTAIQMKSHTGKSACNKSKHNERKDNHIKNPNFVILYKDNYHTYHYKEPVQKPKTTQKMLEVEKGLKSQITTLNAKINTYIKRVLEYEAREKPNLKQIDKLKAKIEDLQHQKSQIPQQQDRRGRPITKRYVEFEFSLTNSNHNKHDKQIQKAFIESVEELKQQNPIFRYLKSTSDIMHLDQESLHVHNINKINSKKCLTSILKELDSKNDNRNFLSEMQNQFNSIVRKNMKELKLEIEPQQKGIKYVSLAKYKELTNFNQPNFNQQEIKANFLQNLENIDQKHNKNIVKKEEKEEKFDFEKITKNIIDTKEISKKDEVSKILKNEDKKSENKIEKKSEKEKLSSKDLSNFKELQKKENEKENENKNEKINEKNKSRGRGRDR